MCFPVCFEVSILCIYKQPEIASYLQVEGHLEILAWMKFLWFRPRLGLFLILKSLNRMAVDGGLRV